MKKLFFIADFFRDNLLGGAECNDLVLINYLEKMGYEIQKIVTGTEDEKYIPKINKEDRIIVSNFARLSQESKNLLIDNYRYIIYEHDHKYLRSRDPSKFVNFLAPQEEIINRSFYKKAHAVFVLSKVCKRIMQANVGNDNIINIGTSLWSDEKLDLIEKLSTSKKENQYGILLSNNPLKGTLESMQWCKDRGIKFTSISSKDENEFLKNLSKVEKLVYCPQVLESFCRVTAEAKMLNCKLVTKDNLLGFASEEIYDLSGADLINAIRDRVKKGLEEFAYVLSHNKRDKQVAFIGKFKKVYDEEGKARSLEKLGFKVTRFDELTFNKIKYNNTKTLLDTAPDLLIFTKLRVPEAQNLIDQCKSRGIKTICWVPDLYFGLDREVEVIKKKSIFQADYVFTPDGGNDDKFNRYGINHHCVRQAIDYWSTDYTRIDKDIDILFVGTLGVEHGKPRADLINFLIKNYGDKFTWVGSNGPEQVRDDKLTNLIQRSKIVIGDCVYSKNYWSNRLYETIGRGGFLIHPKIPGIEKEIIDGEHYVSFEYGNFVDLKQKIDFYLKRDDLRNKISKNGYEFIKKNHSILNRVQEIENIINNETSR